MWKLVLLEDLQVTLNVPFHVGKEVAKKPAKAQLQKTHVKQQTPATPLTNGKRKAEPGGESPPKKLCLEDHIPASFVVDYRERDLRDVKVSDLPKDTKVEDLKSICKGCVDIRGKGRPNELSYVPFLFVLHCRVVRGHRLGGNGSKELRPLTTLRRLVDFDRDERHRACAIGRTLGGSALPFSFRLQLETTCPQLYGMST
ncbi:nucleolin [Ixodes scapularis]